jgi:hypothetical protein
MFLGRGVDYPTRSSAEVKERVLLRLYSPLGLHGLSRVNFTFIKCFYLQNNLTILVNLEQVS